VIYWTGSIDALPGMVREDRCTRIVDKADGAAAFEQALAWALAVEPDTAESSEPT
jgi:hypothetical protein